MSGKLLLAARTLMVFDSILLRNIIMIKVIKNILPLSKAEELLTSINNTSGSWWSYAYKFNEESPKMLGNNLSSLAMQKDLEQNVKYNLNAGKFTYKFRRSTKHVDACNCYECNFSTEYLLKSIRTITISETHLENPYLQERFISIYSPGDFLSMHTDGARSIAFVLNLTKNWLPEYGGLLHTKNKDGTYTAYVPEFNSLMLMDVSDESCPHFVSEVSKYAPDNRIAISGWYNDPS